MIKKITKILPIMMLLAFCIVCTSVNATDTTNSSSSNSNNSSTTENITIDTTEDDELEKYLNSILDIIPSKMEIDLKEIEHEKDSEKVKTKIKEIWKENGIDIQDLENKGVSYRVEIDLNFTTTVEDFNIIACFYFNYSDKYLSKSIELIYNNHSEYNINDETYIKNLSIISPRYYEVDLNYLQSQEDDRDFLNMIGRYYTEQIGDNSIIVKASSGAGGTDGGLNLGTAERGTDIGIFKNGILYDIRTVGNECTIPVIIIPSEVAENEISNYITNAIKQYYPEFAEQITSIEKGTKNFGIDVPNGYTVCSNYTDVESYIIVRTVSEIQLEDSTTGIQLSDDNNALPENTQMVVNKISNGSMYMLVENTLKDTTSKLYVYDITLTSAGTEVQPNGKVKISIPIPSDIDTSKLAVYRISDNGEKIEYEVTIENGYVIFETDHFSTYVLAETITPSQNNQQEKDDTVAEGILPNAGIGISIITILFAVIVISIITYNKYSKMKDIK